MEEFPYLQTLQNKQSKLIQKLCSTYQTVHYPKVRLERLPTDAPERFGTTGDKSRGTDNDCNDEDFKMFKNFVIFAKDVEYLIGSSKKYGKQYGFYPIDGKYKDIEYKSIRAANLVFFKKDEQKLEVLPKYDGNDETIVPFFCLKPYFDIEAKRETEPYFTEAECDDIMMSFLKFLLKQLNELSSTNNLNLTFNNDDVLVQSSFKKTKLSFHIVLQNKICFKHCNHHKEFINYLIFHMKNDTEEESKKFQCFGELFIDATVYTSGRQMRFIHQTKLSEPKRPLKRWNKHSQVDWKRYNTLIRTYDGLKDYNNKDRIIVLPDMFKTDEITRIKTLQVGNRQVNNDLSIEGITLLQIDTGLKNMTDEEKYKEIQTYPDWKKYLFLISNGKREDINIPTKDSQTTKIWKNIGYILKSESNGDAEALQWYIKWSQLSLNVSSNQDVDKCTEIFNKALTKKESIKKNGSNQNLTIATLRTYAKKCKANDLFFRDDDEMINLYFNYDTIDFDVIKEKCKYISCDNNNIFGKPDGIEPENNAPYKHIVIHAYMGKGKTTAMEKVLNNYPDRPDKSIIINSYLVISTRITYATFMSKSLNITSYKEDDPDKYKKDKLVCSIESLFHISRQYDVIVLDECESILKSLSSKTIIQTVKGKDNDEDQYKTFIDAYKKLVWLITKARIVFYADAFITSRTLNFIRQFLENKLLIKNDVPMTMKQRDENGNIIDKPYNKQAIQIKNQNEFTGLLLGSIKENEKNFVCFQQKVKGIQEVDNFLEVYVINERNELMLKEKINADVAESNRYLDKRPIYQYLQKKLIYYSNMDNKLKNETLEDIDKSWINQNLVMTTPLFTVGCSFAPVDSNKIPILHFDNTWIWAFPTCSIRDIMQTHMRVRYTKTGNTFFVLPKTSTLQYIKSQSKNFITTLSMFDTEIKEEKEFLCNHLNTLIKNCNNDFEKSTYTRIRSMYESNTQRIPPELKEILRFNLFEDTLNKKCFEKLFCYFIQNQCGYELRYYEEFINDGYGIYKFPQTISKTKREKIEEYLKVKYSFRQYENILYITKDELNERQRNVRSNSNDLEEKHTLEIQKYYFLTRVNPELSMEHKKQLFHKIYNDTNKKQFFDNAYHEINTKEFELVKVAGKKTGYTINSTENFNPAQKQIVTELCNLIRYTDKETGVEKVLTYSFGHQTEGFCIATEQLVQCCSAFLKQNNQNINIAFNVKKEKVRKDEDFVDVWFIRKRLDMIFKNWTGTILKGLNKNSKHRKGEPTFLDYTFVSSVLLCDKTEKPLSQASYFINNHYSFYLDGKLKALLKNDEIFSENLSFEVETRENELVKRMRQIELQKKIEDSLTKQNFIGTNTIDNYFPLNENVVKKTKKIIIINRPTEVKKTKHLTENEMAIELLKTKEDSDDDLEKLKLDKSIYNKRIFVKANVVGIQQTRNCSQCMNNFEEFQSIYCCDTQITICEKCYNNFP